MNLDPDRLVVLALESRETRRPKFKGTLWLSIDAHATIVLKDDVDTLHVQPCGISGTSSELVNHLKNGTADFFLVFHSAATGEALDCPFVGLEPEAHEHENGVTRCKFEMRGRYIVHALPRTRRPCTWPNCPCAGAGTLALRFRGRQTPIWFEETHIWSAQAACAHRGRHVASDGSDPAWNVRLCHHIVLDVDIDIDASTAAPPVDDADALAAAFGDLGM